MFCEWKVYNKVNIIIMFVINFLPTKHRCINTLFQLKMKLFNTYSCRKMTSSGSVNGIAYDWLQTAKLCHGTYNNITNYMCLLTETEVLMGKF